MSVDTTVATTHIRRILSSLADAFGGKTVYEYDDVGRALAYHMRLRQLGCSLDQNGNETQLPDSVLADIAASLVAEDWYIDDADVAKYILSAIRRHCPVKY